MHILVLSLCLSLFINQKVRGCLRSLPKINENDTHVVTTFAFSPVDIRRQQSIEKTFCNLAKLDFALHLDINVVNNLLASFRLPDTIAAHDSKIRLASYLVHLDVGQRRYCLLVQLQSHVFLVSNIANCS